MTISRRTYGETFQVRKRLQIPADIFAFIHNEHLFSEAWHSDPLLLK
ncbi:MAG: hypothetical protein H7222_05465 [Methylotenera sp.]|nr:hypothetical protein [Oligoflexia bacterium]